METEHLIELGHRKIGMLAGNLELSSHRDRLEGSRKAMQESHLPVIDEFLVTGDVQVGDGLVAGRRLLALPTPPTAIMASNNKLLLGILEATDERKISIPDELGALGFDDYLWNQHFNPRLTAVAQPARKIGKKSFELLLKLIEPVDPRGTNLVRLMLPTELHVRISTVPPRKD